MTWFFDTLKNPGGSRFRRDFFIQTALVHSVMSQPGTSHTS